MGQSLSSSSSTGNLQQPKKRRLLITPKKLIRLRRQSTTGATTSSAQNPKRSGEDDDDDNNYQSADTEQLIKTNDLQLPPLNEEQVLSRQSETHTYENAAATTSTTTAKHNSSERAFSHDLTAKDESLIEDLIQQLRELIENLLSSDHSDAPIVIEIDSEEKSLRILPQSSLARDSLELREIPSHHGGKIVIREQHFGTPSSSDSLFVDAFSSPITECEPDNDNLKNLRVTKLEQFSFISESPHLQNIRNESLECFDAGSNARLQSADKEEEMPIIKNGSAKASTNGQSTDGSDKGIFSVSRVKRIELSEIPLDIATTAASSPAATTTAAAIEQQQSSVTTSTKTSNGNSSSSSGANSVLHRVISLTTANHNDNNNFTKSSKPAFIPEKLHFSAYEKFEGQMLLNWFSQSIPASLTTSFNENDLTALTSQYCTNLLMAGIIKPLDGNNDNSFKTNLMYQWTHKEPTTTVPGRIEAGVMWPYSSAKSNFSSPPKRPTIDGESRIPKLVATFTSTPKPRSQSISYTPDNSILLNGSECDQKKIADLKLKLNKCDTIQETLTLIKSFFGEFAMQSSESSTNSGAMTSSLFNSTDLTIFNKQDEQKLLNILEKQKSVEVLPKTSPSRTPIVRTPPKSRTTPSTPTRPGQTSTRIRRNLSSDSVNRITNRTSTLVNSRENNSNSATVGCKKCMQLAASKITSKRLVDKATVMDVEPIEFPKAPETRDVEIQTDVLEETIENSGEKETKQETAIVIPPPPPPPPPMPILNSMPPPLPPPMPMSSNCPKPPPGPPIPPPFPTLNGSSQIGNKGPCPFPPPPQPVQGPGKLQNASSQPTASSLNSSSSTANGNKPKPMPFPAFEFYQTNTLRKNAVNPPKPMKPLYWTRIVAPIAQDVIDGNESPEGIKDEELWKEIDETVLDNIDEFTELFSRQGVLPKAKESTPLPKVKAIKVLDSKRSQNVGIFVRSIHVDFAEIEHAIYHCDTSVVSLETLQNIMAIKATNDELALIKEAITVHNADEPLLPPLDVPEQFLLKLSQITSSAERISCIVFQDEFEEHCTNVSRKLLIVRNLCEFLLENEELKEVFSIILTLGNFMNGGNRQRGQADGFGLEILGKLKDVKSKDPKITLLHFIVKTYIARTRKSGCSIVDITLPVPDPIVIDKSLSIDFEECTKQLTALRNKVEECKKTTEKVIATSTEEHLQPFKDKMETFYEMASKKIESRFMKIEECKKLFLKTIKFYKYLPKSGTFEEATPSQFFEYWTSFTNDFNGIFKKEVALLTNELLKKTRQTSKPQSKPAQGENNLKARINRLKSRDK